MQLICGCLVRYLTEDQERREEFVRTTVLEKVR